MHQQQALPLLVLPSSLQRPVLRLAVVVMVVVLMARAAPLQLQRLHLLAVLVPMAFVLLSAAAVSLLSQAISFL